MCNRLWCKGEASCYDHTVVHVLKVDTIDIDIYSDTQSLADIFSLDDCWFANCCADKQYLLPMWSVMSQKSS